MNLVIVISCAPLFGIRGNGLYDSTYLILGTAISIAWVLGLAVKAYRVSSDGYERNSVWMVSMALPYGVVAFFTLLVFWEAIKTILK